MCCMIAALFAFGPRAAILIWYVLEPVRWNAAFDSSSGRSPASSSRRGRP